MKRNIFILMLIFTGIVISASAQIKVYSGGNTFIGSTSITPITQLHIDNASNIGPQITLSAPSGGTPGIVFRPYQPSSWWSNPAQAMISATDNNFSADIHFWTKNPGAQTNSLVERMTILGTGYVGIGTTTPNNLLQVANLINFDNTLYNTFLGYQSGVNSVGTGTRNIALGYYALNSNTTGYLNTAIGYTALQYCTGNENTAVGGNALNAGSTTGSYNTALGFAAGSIITTGSYNTAIGYGATFNANNLSNATAIGNGAIATASNYLQLGNSTVSVIHGQVAYTYSDKRFKFNIHENVKGLEFIKKLRPVTYQMDTKAADNFLIQNMPDSIKAKHQAGMDFITSSTVIHSGFIAQEVDSVSQKCGFVSSIVHKSANSTDPYALSYEEIVVPLVKAVQELSKANDSLKSAKKTTDSLLTVLQKQLIINTTNLQQQINTCCPKASGQKTTGDNSADPTTDVELVSKSAILYQNMPNPFGDGTVVKYFVPENITSASIIFYDEFGNEINNVELPNKGITAVLNLTTLNLALGVYSYSLIVNGKVIDTKKMMKSK